MRPFVPTSPQIIKREVKSSENFDFPFPVFHIPIPLRIFAQLFQFRLWTLISKDYNTPPVRFR